MPDIGYNIGMSKAKHIAGRTEGHGASMESSVQNQLTSNRSYTMKVRTFKDDLAKVEAAIATLEGLAGQIETVSWILAWIAMADTTSDPHEGFCQCVNDATRDIEEVKNNLDEISSRLAKLVYKNTCQSSRELANNSGCLVKP